MPGIVVGTCRDWGELQVDPVVLDHDSLSGGVGGALTKVGGCGSDFGAGGIYTGVSYGLGGGGAVSGVDTPHAFLRISEGQDELKDELTAASECVSTFELATLVERTAQSSGRASRSAGDNEGDAESI